MTPLDLTIRNATYRLFAELGRAPTVDEVAAATGEGSAEVEAAWRRLHDGHALVLHQAGAILMANPFSAVETPHRVEAAGKTWFANCGWDAFGIGAALHVDSTIHTTCPDCGESIDIEVCDGRPTETGPVWHVLVPAREWWNDIGFTRGTMLVFRSEAHVTAWLAGRPGGSTIPIAKLAELATAWWSDRLAPDWQPHTREQNQAILDRLGLAGEFWRLG